MDEEQFNAFLYEFGKIREDVAYSMGVQGLADIKKLEKERLQNESEFYDDFKEFSRRSLIDPRSRTSSLIQISDQEVKPELENIGSSIEGLSHKTYKVNVENFLDGLVLPLTHSMQLLQDEEKSIDRRYHHETILYLNELLKHAEGQGERSRFILIDALQRQYAMFMRHPVWNSMRALGRYIVAPIVRNAFGILFGYRKSQSIDEKILKAITQQTEFLMKGEIEPSRGFWGRLIQGGLVGVVGRGLMATMSLDRGEAQRREDARARGEDAGGNFLSNWLLKRTYGTDIIRRGRHGSGFIPGIPAPPKEESDEKGIVLDGLITEVKDAKKKETEENEKIVKGLSDSREEQQSLSDIIAQMKVDLRQYIRTGSSDIKNSIDSLASIYTKNEDDKAHEGTINREKDENFKDEQVAREENMAKTLALMRKDTKATAREAVRARNMRFLSMIGSIASGVAQSAVLLAGAGAAAGTFFLSKVVPHIGTAVASGIVGLGKRTPLVAGIISAIDAGFVLADENRSKREKIADVSQTGITLGSVVAGGAAGAALGSVVPVIGTTIGGIVGATAGGLAGTELGRRGMEAWSTRGLTEEQKAEMLETLEGGRFSDYMRAREEYITNLNKKLEEAGEETRIANEGFLKTIKRFLKDKWEAVSTSVSSGVSSFVSSAKEKMSETWNAAKETSIAFIKDTYNGIKETLMDFFGGIKSSIKSFFDDIKQYFIDVKNEMVEKVKSLNPTDAIKDAYNSGVDKVSDTASRIIGSARETFSGMFSNPFTPNESAPITVPDNPVNNTIKTLPDKIIEGNDTLKDKIIEDREFWNMELKILGAIEKYMKEMSSEAKKTNKNLEGRMSSEELNDAVRYMGVPG